MPSTTSTVISTDGTPLEYDRAGSGPAVVLLYVGPFTRVESSRSLYAVPAISTWAQGNPETNSRRNQPAVMVPAGRPAEFFTSPISDLIISR